MKENKRIKVKWRGFKPNGSKVSGYFYSSERPHNSQNIVERLVGERLSKFVSVCVTENLSMIKCEGVE